MKAFIEAAPKDIALFIANLADKDLNVENEAAISLNAAFNRQREFITLQFDESIRLVGIHTKQLFKIKAHYGRAYRS